MAKEILQEIYKILQLIISAPVLTLIGVWLGWVLNSLSQRRQHRMESLQSYFAALREVMKVTSNIPPDLGVSELQSRVESEVEFQNSLSGRLVRLFGLRTELIPYLDKEIIEFIDQRFKPLYTIETGTYEIRSNMSKEFAVAVYQLRLLVERVERRLVSKYENISK